MRRATDRAPDRLFERGRMFTESEYNIKATTAERGEYDSQAYYLLQDLYREDRKKDRFKTLDFPQYLENVDSGYLEEKFLHTRKEDPEYYRDAGKLLREVYGGDSEQLKLSAWNVYSGIGVPGSGNTRDKSNVSIKAPEAEKY
jgi:hypothetical protein